MSRFRTLFKPGDLILSLLLILSAVAVTVLTVSRDPGARAVIRVNGTAVRVLSLDQPETVSVEGDLGTTVIEVADGGVRIVSSPCPNHTCVKMGTARMKGQTLVCVPNRVVVIVEGGGEEGLDGVTG